jgi:hypothetical protein
MQPDPTQHGSKPKDSGDTIGPGQWKLFFTVLVIGCAGLIYWLLRRRGLDQSAALYTGLPLLLALELSLTPPDKSATGATMKGMAIALLLAAPIFQEGYICILFASPLFFAVGLIIAASIDWGRKRRAKKGSLQSAIVATAIALMAMEGVTPETSFPREHEVVVSKVVPAPMEAVRAALAQPPILGRDKPFFLRIFPYPVAVQGEGLGVGDTRSATFVAYKHIFWNRIEGTAVFKVAEASESKIAFELASDTSYVAHYLGWKRSEVELTPTANGDTIVTWRLSFHRKYDPYWYFGTLQKYAVGLVAEELIDHAVTPRT